MDELKELISVISRHKVKQIEIVGNNSSSNDHTKYDLLYTLVRNEDVNSDEEAAQEIYGESDSSYPPYVKLKNRLKHRLVNSLFFIDLNEPLFSDRERAFYTCSKNWLATTILISRKARGPAISLAEKTIRMTQKFEHTELTMHLAQELRRHYSIVQADSKKYNHYDQILSESTVELEAEMLAEKYYTEIMQQFSASQESIKKDVIDKSFKYSKILVQKYASVKSIRFIRMSYLLHIVSRQISYRYEEAVDICNEALTITKQKPFDSKGTIFGFLLRQLSCYIQLMNYEEGEVLARECLKDRASGSYDWYVVMLYYFLLCTHSKKYTQAYSILQEAVQHPKFSGFYENQKQLWHVYEAFTFFLIETGKVKIQETQYDSPRNFRLYKFLNEIPLYSKDKRGINISILIIHVLILLQQRKFSKIIDRVDALNQYCHRYLRRDDTFRANCFIKMLLQLPKADFNRMRAERYAQKYYQKLLTKPLNIAEQGVEVEVVPFEQLWNIVLELLD